MTLQEINDSFIQRFKLQCLLRNTQFIDLGTKVVASLIARGQSDLQRRLLIVETNYPVPILANINVYDLPSNFGRHKLVTSNGFSIKEVSSQKLQEIGDLTGEPQGYAILVSGNIQQLFIYPTPAQTDTTILYYYPDLNFFNPSQSSSQNWGTFDGSSFVGSLKLPDRYAEGVILYMLAEIFPDYRQLYEIEVKRLRGARVFSIESTMGYSMGIDNETNLRGGSVATQVSQITVSGGFSKSYKFTIENGTLIDFEKSGWDGDIDASFNPLTSPPIIVIQSAGAEILKRSFVTPNSAPAEVLVTWVSEYEVLLELPEDYATRTIAFEIGVW